MRARFKAAAALVVAVIATPAALPGAPARVRLLRAASDGALLREVVARTAGEIVAAGFSVDLQDMASASAPAPTPAAAPVSIVIGSPSAVADDAIIEVWLGREVIYRSAVVRDTTSGPDDGRALTAAAVRAVAVMQAALLAREPRPAAAATVVPTPALAPAAAIRESRPGYFGADVGVSVLQSLNGVGATFAPTVHLVYRWNSMAMVGLRAVTLGSSVTAAAAAGAARIRQDLALIDGQVSWRPQARVHPVAGAAAGLYHMSLAGSGTAPFVGRGDTFWGAAVAAGAGLSVDLSPRVALSLESQALWVFPQPRVVIDTDTVGRAGRPSLNHLLGFRLWL